jgi:hypothetical protein
MVDFFRDMSHGTLDLSGTKIFPAKEIGWFTVNAAYEEFQQIRVNEITLATDDSSRRGEIVNPDNRMSHLKTILFPFENYSIVSIPKR